MKWERMGKWGEKGWNVCEKKLIWVGDVRASNRTIVEKEIQKYWIISIGNKQNNFKYRNTKEIVLLV